MKPGIPLGGTTTPGVVAELITRLKVKDVMSTNLFCAERSTPLRNIQKMMREKRLSGIPIAEGKRLLGLISVDDIIRALDKGHINDTAEKHMTKQLTVLEDDMPLSFAISYFNQYAFGRFPVVNKERSLVGIITSRDVLSKLLEELNHEIFLLENQIPSTVQTAPGKLHKEFFIKRFDFEGAGQASFEIKKILKNKKIDPKIIRRVAVASYELEINIAIHSVGGQLFFDMDEKSIKITAQDNGPGIKDVQKVIQEGFSTANDWIRSLGFGAGMGLPNIKRVSDQFDIESTVGKGTRVTSIIICPNKSRNKENSK